MMQPGKSAAAGVRAPSDREMTTFHGCQRPDIINGALANSKKIAALHCAHQKVSAALAATDEPDPNLIDAAAEIEGAVLAARPVTVADAYRRLLALCPTLASDLFAPELAPLRAEIEALIGGEV